MAENRSEKKKSGGKVAKLAAFIVFIAFGILCGSLYADYALFGADKSESATGYFVGLGLFTLAVIAVFLLHTVIHELGHMIFGMLTGYRFSSFRIGSIMFIKENGRLSVKSLNIPGTLGQCLMIPPTDDGQTMPFILYNMGGVIINALTAAVALAVSILVPVSPLAALFLRTFAVVGFFSALSNGLPINMGTVDNDGCNNVSMMKNPAAVKALRTQLLYADAQLRGSTICDMPEGLVYIPSEEDMHNTMTAFIGIIYCCKLMEQHQFAEAQALMEQYFFGDYAIADLNKKVMCCDIICCELMLENRTEHFERLYTKEQANLMKTMGNYPSIIRTEYFIALLHNNDSSAAEKLLTRFEKAAKTHPYSGEIVTEREMLRIADRIAEQRKGLN